MPFHRLRPRGAAGVRCESRLIDVSASIEDSQGHRHRITANDAIVTLPPPLVLACAEAVATALR